MENITPCDGRKSYLSDWLQIEHCNGGKKIVTIQKKNKENIFENWYYIKDPTHVVFYTKNTFLIIAKMFKWDCEFLNNNLVFFKKIKRHFIKDRIADCLRHAFC